MHKHAGVTLPEVILVMVIASSIFWMGIRMYLSYRVSSDSLQVQANVDAIFQAMSAYYRANCSGTTNANGQLHPSVIAGATKSINIQTDLINPGYLDAKYIIRSPLVNAGGSGYNGYVAQFVRVNVTRNVCTGTTGGVAAFDTNAPCNSVRPIGTVVMWRAQVSVQLNSTLVANSSRYLNVLSGECLSSFSGSTVTPCPGVANGSFVVWSRSISNTINKQGSTYWESIPLLTQFKQEYTTYSAGSLATGANTSAQYFLCN